MTNIYNKNNRNRVRNTLLEPEESQKSLLSEVKEIAIPSDKSDKLEMPEVKRIVRPTSASRSETIDLRRKIEESKASRIQKVDPDVAPANARKRQKVSAVSTQKTEPVTAVKPETAPSAVAEVDKAAEKTTITETPAATKPAETGTESKSAELRDKVASAEQKVSSVIGKQKQAVVQTSEKIASIAPISGKKLRSSLAAAIEKTVKPDKQKEAVSEPEAVELKEAHSATSKIPAIDPKRTELNSTTEIKLAAIQERLRASGKYILVDDPKATSEEPTAPDQILEEQKTPATAEAVEAEEALKIAEKAEQAASEKAVRKAEQAASEKATEKAVEKTAKKAEPKPKKDRVIEVMDPDRIGVSATAEEATEKTVEKPVANKADSPSILPVFNTIKQGRTREPREKKPRSTKKTILTVAIIVVALAAIYVGGIYLWEGKFLPNTYINSQNVGSLDAEAAEKRLLPQNTDYNITELTGEESFPLSSIDYQLSFTEPIQGLIDAQNRYLWPFSILSKKEIDNAVLISYDQTKLADELKQLDAFDENKIIDPQDAYIGKGSDGHYEIIPEVMGTRLDFDKTYGLIKSSIEGGNFAIDLPDKECYIIPTVYKDNKELSEDLKLVQYIGEESISIDMTGETLVIEPTDIIDLVDFDSAHNFTVNEEALAKYVNKLADKYNTYLTKRPFKTSYGETITVGGNHTDDYGIDTYGFLMNREQMINILRECIMSKEDQYFEAVWDVPALTRNQENGDIGDTYIEISLTLQHLWQYKDGVLVFETDVVTGLDTDQRRTPWGVFRAYDKAQNVTLKGEMGGERWNTQVAYWISVTWTAVGIHDATWQPGFGGDLYTYIGSHGCINVSLEAAQAIYELVDIGTPIVIYY